jgi:hypothetical protein
MMSNWVQLRDEEDVWDDVKRMLAKYHKDEEYLDIIENARSNCGKWKKCFGYVNELQISRDSKMIIAKMIKLKWDWAEPFLFAGYDEETKTYESDFVPMGYSIELEELFKKLKKLV